MPGYRPVAELRGKRPRYVTLTEASLMLDGLLSPGTIRDLVVRGQVPGAIRAGRRYYVLRSTVGDLITDMSAGVPQDAPVEVEPDAEIGWHSRRAHTVLDGYLDAG